MVGNPTPADLFSDLDTCRLDALAPLVADGRHVDRLHDQYHNFYLHSILIVRRFLSKRDLFRSVQVLVVLAGTSAFERCTVSTVQVPIIQP